MLVLSRKIDQEIIIGDSIKIMLVDIRGDKVRIGIEAPPNVSIWRKELLNENGEIPKPKPIDVVEKEQRGLLSEISGRESST